jgi:hypothetical protein
MDEDTAQKIKELEKQEDGFLKTHRTLIAAYKKKKAPRYKELASAALDESTVEPYKADW